ncbi:MAG: hypothetical protein ABW143_09045 [Acidimicrobiales bacterium]
MVSAEATAAIRRGQAGIRRLVERDLAAFWRTLDLTRPEAARDALLRFVPTLVSTYGDAAASLAADWYDEVRANEGIPGRFRARVAVPDQTEAVEGTVRRAAGYLFTDTPTLALTAISTKAGKYALTGSRHTITSSSLADPQASGWQRITRAGACDFCSMLSGRGGVYRKDTVDFAAHGDCNCAAAPSWDPDAPEVDVRAYSASSRTSRMAPDQREAHNARVRAWIRANQ